MKVASRIVYSLALPATFLWATPPAIADAGVFFGNGQNLHQITSKTIRLISIDVTIRLGTGEGRSDGGPAGLNKKVAEPLSEYLANYRCKFVLRNLSNKPEEIQVGFPVEAEVLSQMVGASPSELSEWKKQYAFVARDEKDTYQVGFVQRKPKSGPGEFGNIFTWNMHFEPSETRTLSVSYHIPISFGLDSTSRDENTQKMTPESENWLRTRFKSGGAFQPEVLDLALVHQAQYITSTGSSWSGNVETATFTLFADSFERCIDRDGLGKEATQPDIETQGPPPFPLQHPWWFREIAPGGWKSVKGGVQWSYKDFKPKDAIEVRYFLTTLPKSPEDVNTFADWFQKRLNPGVPVGIELKNLREVLLATYGKEPEDSLAKRFAEDQLWYAPRKDFSMSDLSQTQKAVLEKLDARIAVAGSAK